MTSEVEILSPPVAYDLGPWVANLTSQSSSSFSEVGIVEPRSQVCL
jgi:hypothetical protein